MRLRVLEAVAVCSLIVAASSAATATAATLSVTVTPTTVHQNGTYTTTIAGRYDRRAMHSTPSLLAFIQYTGSACRATATAEYQLPTRNWNWLFYPAQQPQPSASFRHLFHDQARTRFGARRVCAYLYARKITPSSTDKPLASASAGFSNVRG